MRQMHSTWTQLHQDFHHSADKGLTLVNRIQQVRLSIGKCTSFTLSRYKSLQEKKSNVSYRDFWTTGTESPSRPSTFASMNEGHVDLPDSCKRGQQQALLGIVQS